MSFFLDGFGSVINKWLNLGISKVFIIVMWFVVVKIFFDYDDINFLIDLIFGKKFKLNIVFVFKFM